jgi:hypothetical protein
MAKLTILKVERTRLPHAGEYKVTYLWNDNRRLHLYVTEQDELGAMLRLKTLAIRQGHTVEIGEQDGAGADTTY